MKHSIIVINDKEVIKGEGFGACGVYPGELVFNTSMIGYVEAMTDPSYAGQILVFSYPLIGNYGVGQSWQGSSKIQPKAVIVSELSDVFSHKDGYQSFEDFCKEHNVGGMKGVDVRFLVKRLTQEEIESAVLCVYEDTPEDLVRTVTRSSVEVRNLGGQKRVGIIDYGVKESIISSCTKRNAEVIIFPATVKTTEIISYDVDGIILSNGPGDPESYEYTHKTINELLESGLPLFGICLGHQLVACATGAKAYKLPFGHRGVNHPVFDMRKKKAYITSQNHGYAIDSETLHEDFVPRFKHLNDGSVEGVSHKTKPVFTVQFHPEARPGTQDTSFLFDEFFSFF